MPGRDAVSTRQSGAPFVRVDASHATDLASDLRHRYVMVRT
jgi:hypothetical protein